MARAAAGICASGYLVLIPAENTQLLQMCLGLPLHSKDLMGLMTCLGVCLLLVLETHSVMLIISEKHRNGCYLTVLVGFIKYIYLMIYHN